MYFAVLVKITLWLTNEVKSNNFSMYKHISFDIMQ